MYIENRPKSVPLSEGGIGSDMYKKLKCPECGKEYKHFSSYIKYMHGGVQLCSYNCRWKYAEKHPLETKETLKVRRTSDRTQRYHNDPEYKEHVLKLARENYHKNKIVYKKLFCNNDGDIVAITFKRGRTSITYDVETNEFSGGSEEEYKKLEEQYYGLQRKKRA